MTGETLLMTEIDRSDRSQVFNVYGDDNITTNRANENVEVNHSIIYMYTISYNTYMSLSHWIK